MPELRFRFAKRGRAAYLSHLDVMRTFQRAFIRAGIRIRHSEGFNPHPKMSIALPLQLGCESVCELLDASVIDGPEDMVAALNLVLPEGIEVLAVGEPRRPVREIAWTEWSLRFRDVPSAQEAERVFRLPELPVEKKTKRGLATLDIAPHIRLLSREGEELRMILRADSPTINAGDLKKALTGRLNKEIPMRCLRLRLMTENKESFQ
jgi:radical SAM-linked protein